MCNAYRIGRDIRDPTPVLPDGLLRNFTEDRLIRRTDHAPIYAGGTDLVTMRWGFERPGLGTVNNSREDNLDGPMWRKAFRERRCLVSATGFYEFSGPKGLKRTHFFTRADGAWMWIAGISEESAEHGLCFSMITAQFTPRTPFPTPLQGIRFTVQPTDNTGRPPSESTGLDPAGSTASSARRASTPTASIADDGEAGR
jgi:putative SOS response-associated peptidase YedK